MPVTTPLLTVATLALEVVQTIVASDALAGATVAVSVAVSSTRTSTVAGDTVMPVTLTGATVTSQVSVNVLPDTLSVTVQVIVAVPYAFAVTLPLSTVATLVFELLHATA